MIAGVSRPTVDLPPNLPLSTGHQETARAITGHVVVPALNFPKGVVG